MRYSSHVKPETQQTLALLKILALGNQEVSTGKVKLVSAVVARLRAGRATDEGQTLHPCMRAGCSAPPEKSRAGTPQPYAPGPPNPQNTVKSSTDSLGIRRSFTSASASA